MLGAIESASATGAGSLVSFFVRNSLRTLDCGTVCGIAGAGLPGMFTGALDCAFIGALPDLFTGALAEALLAEFNGALTGAATFRLTGGKNGFGAAGTNAFAVVCFSRLVVIRFSLAAGGRVPAGGFAADSFFSTAGSAFSLASVFFTNSFKFANDAAIARFNSSVVSGVNFAGAFMGDAVAGVELANEALVVFVGATSVPCAASCACVSPVTGRGGIPSPGKLMPQKPGAGCVNSSSTYPFDVAPGFEVITRHATSCFTRMFCTTTICPCTTISDNRSTTPCGNTITVRVSSRNGVGGCVFLDPCTFTGISMHNVCSRCVSPGFLAGVN